MNLFSEVKSAIESIGHGWTTVDKGQVMASMIIAVQPAVSVEIGVYAGKGLVSLALAHKAVGHGIAVGIDPYSAKDALEGQIDPADQKFWGQDTDYNSMREICQSTLDRFGCNEYYKLIVQRSDQVQPPPQIGVLRIDGNHGDMAVRDAIKWAPRVQRGGFLIVDDLGWSGGATTRAAQWIAAQPDWKKLYPLDDGVVFQRL